MPSTAAWTRKDFVRSILGAAVVTIGPSPGYSMIRPEKITIQQVIDLFLAEVPGSPLKTTVDTIKSGDANQPVNGIVTTMFATVELIRKAAALGANFIIAHEPTFYNHLDETNWLETDPVYRYKKQLLDEHRIVVWRNHDYIHTHKPDGVRTGVLRSLEWQRYQDNETPSLVKIPATSLRTIIDHCKQKLGIEKLKFIGNLDASCSRIMLMPGASGGRAQIGALQKNDPDLLICGEINEWETSEYIRDARAAGSKTALIVLGHIPSEEPGSEWMKDWLQQKLPGIKVTHIPTGETLRTI